LTVTVVLTVPGFQYESPLYVAVIGSLRVVAEFAPYGVYVTWHPKPNPVSAIVQVGDENAPRTPWNATVPVGSAHIVLNPTPTKQVDELPYVVSEHCTDTDGDAFANTVTVVVTVVGAQFASPL
jgi:hypothetical protein